MEFNNLEIDSASSANQDIILIVDEDYFFLDVIAPNEDLLYKKRHEILGNSIETIYEPQHVVLFTKVIKDTLSTNNSVTIRYNLTVMAGADLYFEAICSPMAIKFDNKRAAIITIKNITEKIETQKALKASENNFHNIYETANAGIAIKNEKGYYIAANKAFENLLGYPEDELKEIHFTKFIADEDMEHEIRLHNELIANKTKQYTIEKKFMTKSGNIIWGSLHVSVMRDEKNVATNCISVLVDITDRKMHEQLLMNLNNTKDKFFSIISHDLQNPLIGIIGLGEILKENIDTIESWERDRIIRWIIEGSQTARNLLINLLEWSRSQTNQIDLKPNVLNLYDLTEKNILLTRNLAESKKITITNLIPQNCNVWVDINIINTIVRNLIVNAIKFTHKSGDIELYATIENDNCILSIKDSGIGMNKEQLARLFNIHSKFSRPGTYNEKGTGLGLILCKEFIDKYNGKIWATSTVNKGSVFNFTIPLAESSVVSYALEK
jgi:PAS domain S-box-containing protein